MKIVKINKNDVDFDLIQEAKDILAEGGIVAYPTDTVYGLGANVFNEEAVKRVFSIKHRVFDNPVSICLHSQDQIKEITTDEFYEKYEGLISNNLPGPFTFVVQKSDKLDISKLVLLNENKVNKIGIRIPDSLIARNLATEFPITSTSANLSGKPTLSSPKDIISQLNASNENKCENKCEKVCEKVCEKECETNGENWDENESVGKNEIDLFIDAGVLDSNIPSAVVDLTGNEINVLREGSKSLK